MISLWKNCWLLLTLTICVLAAPECANCVEFCSPEVLPANYSGRGLMMHSPGYPNRQYSLELRESCIIKINLPNPTQPSAIHVEHQSTLLSDSSECEQDYIIIDEFDEELTNKSEVVTRNGRQCTIVGDILLQGGLPVVLFYLSYLGNRPSFNITVTVYDLLTMRDQSESNSSILQTAYVMSHEGFNFDQNPYKANTSNQLLLSGFPEHSALRLEFIYLNIGKEDDCGNSTAGDVLRVFQVTSSYRDQVFICSDASSSEVSEYIHLDDETTFVNLTFQSNNGDFSGTGFLLKYSVEGVPISSPLPTTTDPERDSDTPRTTIPGSPPSPNSIDTASPSKGNKNISIVIGAVLGFLALICIVLAILYIFKIRRRDEGSSHGSSQGYEGTSRTDTTDGADHNYEVIKPHADGSQRVSDGMQVRYVATVAPLPGERDSRAAVRGMRNPAMLSDDAVMSKDGNTDDAGSINVEIGSDHGQIEENCADPSMNQPGTHGTGVMPIQMGYGAAQSAQVPNSNDSTTNHQVVGTEDIEGPCYAEIMKKENRK